MAAVPPAAAAALVPPDPLDHCLSVCGMAQANANRFKTYHDFQTIDDIGMFKPKDAKDLIETYNHRRQANHKFGMGVRRKVEALLYWLDDQRAHNLVINYAEWNNVLMMEMASIMEATNNEDTSSSSPIGVGKIDPDAGWVDWKTRFVAMIASEKSVHGNGIKMDYLTKERKPAGWNPATNAASVEERRMYQIPMTGAKFKIDNTLLWQHIQNVTIGETAYAWISHLEASQNGVAAWHLLEDQFEGTSAVNRRVILAQQVISLNQNGVFYRNEHSFQFIKYAAKLQQAYQTIAKYRNAFAPETMVQRLHDGIQVQNNLVISIAKQKILDDYYGNWLQAVQHMSTKVTEAFGVSDNKKRGGYGRRRVSSASSGRGRGGRGRGRGRGRGGRGGRGGGRGGGSSSTTFNGVDCSDFSRDFTDDEFHKIGYEGRGYVRKKRQEAKNNNKRDVQEVNTQDDGDGPEKKPKSEKGGQNGSAFGRQKAGEKI